MFGNEMVQMVNHATDSVNDEVRSLAVDIQNWIEKNDEWEERLGLCNIFYLF